MKLKEMADTRITLERQGYPDDFIRQVIAQRLALATAKLEAKRAQEQAWREINKALRAAKRQEAKARTPQARIDSQVNAPMFSGPPKGITSKRVHPVIHVTPKGVLA